LRAGLARMAICTDSARRRAPPPWGVRCSKAMQLERGAGLAVLLLDTAYGLRTRMRNRKAG